MSSEYDINHREYITNFSTKRVLNSWCHSGPAEAERSDGYDAHLKEDTDVFLASFFFFFL